MNYDTWKTTPPDMDICTEEPLICPCPACVEWRDNREPPELTFEDAMVRRYPLIREG